MLAFGTPSAARHILKSTAKRLPKSPTVAYFISIYKMVTKQQHLEMFRSNHVKDSMGIIVFMYWQDSVVQ